MLGFQIPAFNDLRGTFIQFFAFQIIINIVIGDTQGRFIRQGGAIVFQICRWRFLVKVLRATQRGKQLLTLTFVQTEERINIGTAVAILGEETRDGFCRMIGTDHNAFGHPGNAVLRFHTFTGFFIAADKIAQLNACFAKRLLAGQHRSFDIDGEHTIGLDEGDGILAILFIGLHAIGKTHGNKLQRVITRLFAEL